jgi:Ras-related protein Rab-5C
VRELQRQADPSIVIMLVGNKLDLASQRQTPRELGEKYAQEEGLLFTEASAKTGDGVEQLFMDIGTFHVPAGPFGRPSSRLHPARKLPIAPRTETKTTAGKGVKVSGAPAEAGQACNC